MRRWSIPLVMVLASFALLVAILGACSVSGDKTSKNSETSSAGSSAAPAVSESPSQSTAASSASGGAISGAASSAGSADSAQLADDWNQKIIRNAEITLKVTDVESSLATIRTIATGAGGLVFASSTSFNGDTQLATMTLDVPADQFDQVVNALRSAPEVKKVERESISSQDVTDQYVDLQSQLKNLQATESRLLDLLQKATELNDILTINQQLSSVQGQIETITGRLNFLDKRSQFSRITLTISPVTVSSGESGGVDLGQAVRDGWEASLRALTVVVKIGVFFWWLVPLGVILFGALALRRQRRSGTGPISS